MMDSVREYQEFYRKLGVFFFDSTKGTIEGEPTPGMYSDAFGVLRGLSPAVGVFVPETYYNGSYVNFYDPKTCVSGEEYYRMNLIDNPELHVCDPYELGVLSKYISGCDPICEDAPISVIRIPGDPIGLKEQEDG